jgi:putative hydrolase of the HAD superfamily
MKNIKAVLFDLDGTLRQHIPNGGDVFIEYVRGLGIKISEEDRIRSAHWTHHYFANSLEIRADRKIFGENGKDFWINYAKRCLVSLGIPQHQAVELSPQVSKHMNDAYKPEAYVPQDAYELLEALHSDGRIMGVVSNRETPYTDELEKIHMNGYFKFSLAGGEINHFKPDREIFEHALELAGTSAQETIYVGDNYFADVLGARRAGLMPVLYDPVSLFPEPECAVIKSFAELPKLIN